MKWSREDQARFHTNRRELYARFLVLASEVHQNATLHEKSREFEGSEASTFVEKYGSLTSEKGNQLYLLLEEITLVGNTDVVKAAREIVVTVLHWRIASHLPGSGEMDKASGDYFGSKRQKFIDAARTELGIAPLEIEFKHNFPSQKTGG